MIPSSAMPSGYSINISTGVLGYSNYVSTSHSWETHPYSLWYKVSPIRILVDIFVATVENDSVNSTPGTCMYSLNKLLDFGRINPSVSSSLLNTHLTGTVFLPFAFHMIFLIGIHAFLDRKFFTSEIADIFHKCPFDVVIASLRVSGSPASI